MGNLRIGWGRREISLELPMNMNGQAKLRITEGIFDPTYVTALCLDGGPGQQAVVFCSCDLGTVSRELVAETRAEVAKRCPGLPVEAIILHATHTHSSGDIYNQLDETPDGISICSGEKYRAHVARMCTEAVLEAWSSRSPGGMAYGYGYAVVAHSRRSIYLEDMGAVSGAMAPNGHGVMYGNTKKDSFSHYEAGADHFLNLMFTVDEEDKLTGIVVNVPCPSQLCEWFTMLSADFWADVRELVAEKYGPEVYVLPQCGAAGDLSPRILHYKEAQQRRMALKYGLPYDLKDGMHTFNKVIGERKDIAQRILQGIDEVYDWAKKDIQREVSVYHLRREPELALRKITPEEKAWCEQNIAQMREAVPQETLCTPEEYRSAVSRYNYIKRRNTNVLRRFEEEQGEDTMPAVLHAVRVGEVAFATNEFELYMDYMHRIQARSPFIQTFVVQLADGRGGYLSTERGTRNKGYSASLFDNRISSEGGQQLVEATLAMLAELEEKREA